MIGRLVMMIAVLAVTACTEVTTTRSVSLADGTILTTPPPGYCVDNAASQPRNNFAFLAPCAALDLDVAPPDVIGFATIQVGPEASGTIAQNESALRDFLTTNDGARLLSASGDPDDITILSTQAFNNQVMVHFADAGAPPVAGLQNEEWRAFRAIGGRLVTIGVRGLATSPLQDGPGAGLLKLILSGVGPATTQRTNADPDA